MYAHQIYAYHSSQGVYSSGASCAAEAARFPSYSQPNLWPTEELPAFEPAFKALGR